MELEDDMLLVIVGNEDEENSESEELSFPVPIKEELMDENDVMKIIETVIRHGQSLDTSQEDYETLYVKQEIDDEEDDTFQQACMNIREEYPSDDGDGNRHDNGEDFVDCDFDDDNDYDPNEEDEDENYSQSGSESDVGKDIQRRTLIAPAQRKSFVQDLKQQYPELRNDRDALVKSLAEIMRNVKRPSPPRDYFIINDILFECRKCGSMAETEQAAARHFQEKHGSRYLVCFACGVDFRSTTNLYKHEKRCVAPDAGTMLRARALCLGRKGRGRPFMPKPKDVVLRQPIGKKFECSDCSAVFTTKINLVAHVNMHRGIRPYRCVDCPRAYTSQARLQRHMRQHSDDHFMCDYCARAFKVKAALVVHLNTHAPLRKFGCSECERRYATKNALNHHVRRVHRNLPPACPCPICPMSYPRMSLVRDHMKKKHGMSLMTRKMFFKAMPTLTDSQLQQAKEILKSDTPLYSTASSAFET